MNRTMSRTMSLHDVLMDDVPELPSINPDITGLSADSRTLHPGNIFLALSGKHAHGLEFLSCDQAAKVAAILFEPPAPKNIDLPEKAVAVPGLSLKLGHLAKRFYGAPSRMLTVIGVTGTNGKTSTVQLLAQALNLGGTKVGSIGTLGSGLYGALVASDCTTPDVVSVHRLLEQMRAQGATHVAMEVSSHALDQGRVADVDFSVAVFTNLTHDHLDYHETMQAYAAAKAKLFAWSTLKTVVVNLDDPFGLRLFDEMSGGVQGIGVSSRGHAHARLHAESIELSTEGLRFTLVEESIRFEIVSRLLGRFNVDNLLAVAGSLRALGWSLAEVAGVLPSLSTVDGRMNRVGGIFGQPLVVIDYAHTPDALEQALSSLRAHTSDRLICVFGCGGERDRAKRPLMAAIAERGADSVIVTDDNPRNEDGETIVAEILSGFSHPERIRVERDRARAIATALGEASAQDIVLIAGKGHEAYQEIQGIKHVFDDVAVAKEFLMVRP